MRANDSDKKRWPTSLSVRLSISLALIACIVWWLGGLGKILAIVERVSLGLAALVVILNMLDRALMTFKWLWLLRAKDVYPGLLPALKIYCASMIWGIFLPSTLGPDAIRAVSIARTGVDANEVVASIAVERVFGFLSTLFVGICSLFLFWFSGHMESRFIIVWWIALIVLASALLALAVSLNERAFHLIHDRVLRCFNNNRLAEKLKEFHQTYLAYRKHAGALVTFSVLSVAEQLIPVAALWLIALALNIQMGILPFLVAVPLSLLVSRLPVGVAGLGTFEAAFVFLLAQTGLAAADAVAISFTGRILEIVAVLPWWFAHVTSAPGARPATKPEICAEPATAKVTNGV